MYKITGFLMLLFFLIPSILFSQSYQKYSNQAEQAKQAENAEQVKQAELAEQAKLNIESKGNIKVMPLDRNINSKGSDFGLSISHDGKMLFFISDREGSIINPKENAPSDDIWVVYKQESNGGLLSFPKNIDYSDKKDYYNVNSIENEGPICFAHDDSGILYISSNNYPNGSGSLDIFISQLKDGNLLKPFNIGGPINTQYWESHPTLSIDNKRLFFASNRPGPNSDGSPEVENVDIWYSDWDPEMEEWGIPKNIGGINSKKCDWAPTMSYDGKTLFFASDGRVPNVGGLDLYFSRYDAESDSWSIPELLPEPINSIYDDNFISVSKDGKTLYFSSTRLDESKKKDNYDLFQAEVEDVLFRKK